MIYPLRTGWWLTYPSEKYESPVGIIIPNIWKNDPSVPNHQPENDDFPWPTVTLPEIKRGKPPISALYSRKMSSPGSNSEWPPFFIHLFVNVLQVQASLTNTKRGGSSSKLPLVSLPINQLINQLTMTNLSTWHNLLGCKSSILVPHAKRFKPTIYRLIQHPFLSNPHPIVTTAWCPMKDSNFRYSILKCASSVD